jgi:hypothetical protein
MLPSSSGNTSTASANGTQREESETGILNNSSKTQPANNNHTTSVSSPAPNGVLTRNEDSVRNSEINIPNNLQSDSEYKEDVIRHLRHALTISKNEIATLKGILKRTENELAAYKYKNKNAIAILKHTAVESMQQDGEPEDSKPYLNHLIKVQEEVRLLREQVNLINENQMTQSQKAALLQIAFEQEVEKNLRKDEKITSYLETVKSIYTKSSSVTGKIGAFEKERRKYPSHNKIRRTLLPTPPNNLPPRTIRHNRTIISKQPTPILRHDTATNIHQPSQTLRYNPTTTFARPPSTAPVYYPINGYIHPLPPPLTRYPPTNTHRQPPQKSPLLDLPINTHNGTPPLPTTSRYSPHKTHTHHPTKGALHPPINNHTHPPSKTLRYSPTNYSYTHTTPAAIQHKQTTRTTPPYPYPPPAATQFISKARDTHQQQSREPQRRPEPITQEFHNPKTDGVTLPTSSTIKTPQHIGQLNNRAKITNRLGNNIENVLKHLKLKRLNTPRDGHCLLHAVSLSYPSQLGIMKTIESILFNTRLRAMRDKEQYFPFFSRPNDVDNNNNVEKAFTDTAFKYFIKKDYNNYFADLVPLIICDALQIRLVIIDSTHRKNIISTTVIPNEPNTGTKLSTLHIHRENEHYSGLQLTSSPPRTNTIIPSGICNVKSTTKTIPTAMFEHTQPETHTSKTYT